MSTRFAVLGSPIAHSQSPQLHLAAYAALGLDWAYERIECTDTELAGWLAGPGRAFHGCSATMPLKHELIRLASSVDAIAELTGAANTAIGLGDGRLSVFNTDVGGILRALDAAGVSQLDHAMLLGAGATGSSALVALAELGATHVTVLLRDPARAAQLTELANRLGVDLQTAPIDSAQPSVASADILVSALPAGVLGDKARYLADVAPILFDVAYHPWPSELAAVWTGATVISGREMLLEQALLQVRTFVHGSPDQPLENEALVHSAMRSALPAL